ncbi:dnaJ homolog subfamily C member 30, mitochondrial-like [Aricia agestis]|uniref:dnaJ homolog subfamily C member 30, mitochondrial-like n=1 Tax=Aricia agestis TaxID=91739 RepID=UPI001C2030D0|nr:dnaJ homolog subfamily C member 30, mitochondrial-like [Aricia agestis]
MFKQTRVVTKLVRSINTTSQNQKSHYDVLGITPKATQGDIKSAYYKLSKIYHPDKSSDEESAKKFRAITEAYEILCNIKLKKMYDKGLLVGQENTSRMHPEPEPLDPTSKFYKSRTVRNVAPTMDGRTPIYDFDAWSKNHYGELFNKSQYDKDLLSKRQAKQRNDKIYAEQEAAIYVVFMVTGLIIAFVAYGKDNFDYDNIQKKSKPSESSNAPNS